MDESARKYRAWDMARAAYEAKRGVIDFAAAMLINAPRSRNDAHVLMKWFESPEEPEHREEAIKALDKIAESENDTGMEDSERFSLSVGLACGMMLISAHIVMSTINDEWGLPIDIEMWPSGRRRKDGREATRIFSEDDLKTIFVESTSDDELINEISKKMADYGMPVPPREVLERLFKGAAEMIGEHGKPDGADFDMEEFE